MKEIEREVAALGDLKRPDLATHWLDAYGIPPADDVSAPFMRKALAWEIQARELGGHAPSTLRALKVAAGSRGGSQMASVGSRLLREWNGATYEVEVLDTGYRWRGEVRSSLSAIAREITGTKWSGPRFFGLTKRS